MAAVLRASSDGRAALVGCSFGSLVTLHRTLEHPELVSKLVLVGPIVTGPPPSEHFLTRGRRADRLPARRRPVGRGGGRHRRARTVAGAAHRRPAEPAPADPPGTPPGARAVPARRDRRCPP
ncbi:alpha/beta fold hydrolase [Pseudonocardia sp.]|uniref:alpha/beta fold hydrolase n=1 Tax=Pseudonocardia sp. TaxID=60912 RepID=UPI0039C9BC3B